MLRKNIPKKLQLKIWTRDNWHCRYCGEAVFFAPTLKLLDKLSPNHSYYHKNGKDGEMLPIFQKKWASVDHVQPLTQDGENKESNYVTACWECNLKFGNNIPSEGKPKPIKSPIQSNWDGLHSLYHMLSKNQ